MNKVLVLTGIIPQGMDIQEAVDKALIPYPSGEGWRVKNAKTHLSTVRSGSLYATTIVLEKD